MIMRRHHEKIYHYGKYLIKMTTVQINTQRPESEVIHYKVNYSHILFYRGLNHEELESIRILSYI